ncbi:hypothetical protein [[Phormidium] sp. ETS-05]|uniref:hypothetical protein n=1 Tax=[Phormidium] sp. ETS-05 TaxID=222819 RepID=UPI0018EF1F13
MEIYTPRDIYHTVELIGRRVVELFGREKDRSAAVLVRENRQGKFIADILANPESYNIKVNLAQQGIEVYEVAGAIDVPKSPPNSSLSCNFSTAPIPPTT